MKSTPEAVQQPLLPGVADRVSGRVSVEPDVESDGCSDCGELDDRGTSQAIHDPSNGPARDPACTSYVLVTEAGGTLRSGELREHAPLVIGGDTGCARDGAVSSGHGPILTNAASPVVH